MPEGAYQYYLRALVGGFVRIFHRYFFKLQPLDVE